MHRALVLIYSLLALCVLSTPVVHAHALQTGEITAELRIDGAIVDVTVVSPERLSPVMSSEYMEKLNTYLQTALLVTYKSIGCPSGNTTVTEDESRNTTTLTGSYSCAEPITDIAALSVRSYAFRDIFEHPQTELIVILDGHSHRAYLTPTTHEVPRDVGYESTTDRIVRFFYYGIEHIVTGYDHVLFLASLLISIETLSVALLTATIFAVAHALTLFLSLYGVVSVDANIVEPAIALTIAFTALATLTAFAQKKEYLLDSARYTTVFILGLIHGLGFAGSLSETTIPRDTLFSSLTAFTVGLEFGQFILIGIFCTCTLLLRRYTRYRISAIVLSLAIACAAFYWFIERIGLL